MNRRKPAGLFAKDDREEQARVEAAPAIGDPPLTDRLARAREHDAMCRRGFIEQAKAHAASMEAKRVVPKPYKRNTPGLDSWTTRAKDSGGIIRPCDYV